MELEGAEWSWAELSGAGGSRVELDGAGGSRAEWDGNQTGCGEGNALIAAPGNTVMMRSLAGGRRTGRDQW